MKWISVNDGLPKGGRWYLVAVKWNEPDGAHRTTTMAFLDIDPESGMSFWLSHNDSEYNEWFGVTHFMPLPEPPND